MTRELEVSVVVESYNYGEGTDYERFQLALETAMAMVADNGRGEVLLTDTEGSDKLLQMLAERFPGIRRIEAVGLDYDSAKTRAAAAATGEYVVYLDGDCIPEPGWLEHHLSALRAGEAVATGGFTRYEEGFLPSILTVMDFGFLLPRAERNLLCYASNNSGFRHGLHAAAPVPEGTMRCRCYAHAQLLLRRKTPVKMVPEAMVRHQTPEFLPERFRQGYDAVASCWVNPELPETGWLRLGVLAAPILYARNVYLDSSRLLKGYKGLDLRLWQALAALPLFPLFRLVDLMGMLKALAKPVKPSPDVCSPADAPSSA